MSTSRAWVGIAVAALGACGDNAKEPDFLGYDWNERRVLCSSDVGDLGAKGFERERYHREIEAAAAGGWALMLHAHEPTIGISLPWLDQVLTWADDAGLAYYTFRELVETTPPHAGLALAFDDATPDSWVLAQPILAKHGAHVTFFVSAYATIPQEGRDEIAQLHAWGHDLEAHSVTHANAIQYARAHGVDAYVTDEVLPSIQILEDAGYPRPMAFAYPFGAHTEPLDHAIAQHVDKLRTTPGQCPWGGWEHEGDHQHGWDPLDSDPEP